MRTIKENEIIDVEFLEKGKESSSTNSRYGGSTSRKNFKIWMTPWFSPQMLILVVHLPKSFLLWKLSVLSRLLVPHKREKIFISFPFSRAYFIKLKRKDFHVLIHFNLIWLLSFGSGYTLSLYSFRYYCHKLMAHVTKKSFPG